MVYPSNNIPNDVYSNTKHQNVQQEQTNNNSLYTLTNYKLQLNSDLEDPNGFDNWRNTNSHKSELTIA